MEKLTEKSSFQGMLGYFCMTKSLQMVDPTIVAFLRSIEIVFGYIFQVIIMEQIPTVVCLTGAGLTLISILAMSLQDVLLPYIPEKIRFLFWIHSIWIQNFHDRYFIPCLFLIFWNKRNIAGSCFLCKNICWVVLLKHS